VYDAEAEDDKATAAVSNSWLSRIASFISSQDTPDKEAKEALANNRPGPAETILAQADKEIFEKQRQRTAQVQAESESTAKS
jgi:hypothetical protein